MKVLITSLFVLLLVLSENAFYSQVLDNSLGQAFTDKPFFNKTFIKGNKIKSIDGRFNYKKAGEAMFPTLFHYVYQFDEDGYLVSSYETKADDGTRDTTWNKYEYDSQDRLITHKRGDANGLTAIRYIYDDKGRIIKQQFWKEPIDSLGVPEKPILQNEETMTYTNYDGQEKKTVLNSYGLPYIEEMKYFNSEGYLLECNERLTMTSAIKKSLYEYNEKGFISNIKNFEGKTEIPTEEWKYNYDEFGNLLEKQYYRDGVYITETAILYNSKSNLMSAVIIRDVKSSFIMAIRFQDYLFFD